VKYVSSAARSQKPNLTQKPSFYSDPKYGSWPGLYPGTEDDWVDYPNPKNGSTEPELFQGALSTTTDFRRVLSEYLQRRGEHTTQSREFVFPGYSGYSPMGIFKPIPNPDDLISSDGFES
jgi:hypothetical protein